MVGLSQILSIVIEFQVFWLIFLGIAAVIILALGIGLVFEVRKQITYVRLLQKQRLTAQENYRQAIYLLSHEFSTPLQTILTHLSAIFKEAFGIIGKHAPALGFQPFRGKLPGYARDFYDKGTCACC